MYPLQREILYRLITNSCLPFSKLKPKEVDSNLFMYHLKQLVKEDLVCKRTDGKYELTAEGLVFADRLSLSSFKPRIQPKIITMIVCQNKKGEYLLYKRKRQPFIGLSGFTYGKIHLGEKVAQAAERELREKTGLEAKLAHCGEVYLTTIKDGNVLASIFCHVFVGKNPTGQLIKDSEIGECFWTNLKTFGSEKFMPGFFDVLSLVEKRSPHLFFAEFTFNL
ncbi:hypothetical protein A3A14_02820 [Candidatus Daviesbacteria bacterium RIFCSPLOWO2_01_FULL_43_38]|nr:MAG: hypothetical protein A2874_03405 [Candidatus Daviesbacteria bacterium RIFCSPHIGHO2_01_FULL_43_17]OGE36896.1 MAG: hypothetical protein A3E45_03575 [Candidatus Daviesbacteria bacterium RIFCSPHIGHO2_12_FULL_43_11]OGE63562.1 MAG: hypothetical protein A3A14_02820 [Candidatus Daviesbacteria bacterium RIFCSPLOWO2_01_FULL_43_38]OGE70861.1 MAG: hypothetical protein A3J21_00040 [Candidatus Daviesbacteria bacterium RIFCSPLOWO2_02_FULL_43_11]